MEEKGLKSCKNIINSGEEKMSERKDVKDRNGVVLYSTRESNGKTYVTGPDGSTPLGSCSDGQTRNISGEVVAQGESPGLLSKLYDKNKKK